MVLSIDENTDSGLYPGVYRSPAAGAAETHTRSPPRIAGGVEQTHGEAGPGRWGWSRTPAHRHPERYSMTSSTGMLPRVALE